MDHLILNPEWFSPKYSTDFNLVSSTSMGHLYLILCLIQSGLSAWASERCADVFGTAQWRRANSFPTECKFQQDGTRRKSSCQITARWILHLAHFGPHFAWFRHISMGYSWYNIFACQLPPNPGEGQKLLQLQKQFRQMSTICASKFLTIGHEGPHLWGKQNGHVVVVGPHLSQHMATTLLIYGLLHVSPTLW